MFRHDGRCSQKMLQRCVSRIEKTHLAAVLLVSFWTALFAKPLEHSNNFEQFRAWSLNQRRFFWTLFQAENIFFSLKLIERETCLCANKEKSAHFGSILRSALRNLFESKTLRWLFENLLWANDGLLLALTTAAVNIKWIVQRTVAYHHVTTL